MQKALRSNPNITNIHTEEKNDRKTHNTLTNTHTHAHIKNGTSEFLFGSTYKTDELD